MNEQPNPHAGRPFTDDDAAIAAYLDEVSVPALLCSLVHMTGDPSWIRGDARPQIAMLNDYQGGMPAEMQAEVRQRALPAVAAYRDAGCAPTPITPELAAEMMAFLGCGPLADDVVPMFLDDLHLDGTDSGAITWGDEIPADVKADSHVVVVGCGESGLLAGIRLAQAGIPFTIVEKNAGPGGTWWDNRYPGARVDIGSHFYCYSFEPSDHWTEYFAQHPELRGYFSRILDKYDLRRHCRFDTEVTAARFDESSGGWQLDLRAVSGSVGAEGSEGTSPAGDSGAPRAAGRTETIEARFVISAVGALNQPKLPDIPGMETFAGPSFHSARWDHSAEWRGKRFALVGAGASGFQIAPTIADDVARLSVFQRTAQWMLPNFNYHRPVPAGDTWAMRHLPFYGRWFRFLTFYPGAGVNIDWTRVDPTYDDPDGLAVSETSALRRKQFGMWIEWQLQDRPDLLAQSIPDYPPSAKRMLQDDGSWLTCLKKPNVDFVRTPIERIVPEGVVTIDGTLHEADVICYATGFRHNDFLWPIDFVGRAGQGLRAQWGNEPTAYLGITVPNFPNLFCLYGPGTNLAHGASLIFQSEAQVHYVMEAIRRTLGGGHRTIEVTQAAHDEYTDRYRTEIDQTIWAHWSVRHSHFKNPDGKIFTISPWSIPEYWRWTRSVDRDDYRFG